MALFESESVQWSKFSFRLTRKAFRWSLTVSSSWGTVTDCWVQNSNWSIAVWSQWISSADSLWYLWETQRTIKLQTLRQIFCHFSFSWIELFRYKSFLIFFSKHAHLKVDGLQVFCVLFAYNYIMICTFKAANSYTLTESKFHWIHWGLLLIRHA